MTDTLQAIARSLGQDVQTLATISHNVANMNTPGYRGVRAVPEFGRSIGLTTAIDQRDGGLAQTQRALDLALRGEGFFVVERDGQALLVRSGAFRTDAEGTLLTVAGDRVLGESGPLVLPAGEPTVAADGAIRVDGLDVGRLRLVTVADAARLRPAGDGAYAYDGELGAWTGRVSQGALETANVDPAEETVRLMETTRHAESVQRAISVYDKAMETGINQLGQN